MQVARSNAALLLRGGHQVIVGGSRIRAALLVLQLAFAQVLLVGSRPFARSVNNLLTGAGFDIKQIIVALLLCAAAVLGSVLPTMRAARLNPCTASRQ